MEIQCNVSHETNFVFAASVSLFHVKQNAPVSAGGNPYTFPVRRDEAARIQDPFLFSILREKRNGSWTPKRKGRFTRWTCGAGPGRSSRSSDIVQVRVQSLNGWSPLFPRGAASLGASLGAGLYPGSGASGSEPSAEQIRTIHSIRIHRGQCRTAAGTGWDIYLAYPRQAPFSSGPGADRLLFGKTKRRRGAHTAAHPPANRRIHARPPFTPTACRRPRS